MAQTLLLLEDSLERLTRMRAVLADKLPGLKLRHWVDAHAMIRDLPEALSSAAVICLDHDLYTDDPDAPDPGRWAGRGTVVG